MYVSKKLKPSFTGKICKPDVKGGGVAKATTSRSEPEGEAKVWKRPCRFGFFCIKKDTCAFWHPKFPPKMGFGGKRGRGGFGGGRGGFGGGSGGFGGHFGGKSRGGGGGIHHHHHYHKY